ncbi:MAG: efflux RND transporter permease subunit, partial [Micrococcales bacterium]|nr:efflux RND transporter permease subunit [Micrococcales bacterium]
MSWLARLSLRNRAVVLLTTLAAMLAGGLSLTSLKTELIPSLQFPAAIVIGSYPGTAPQIMENRVAKVVEQAVVAVPGVQSVTSTSSTSLSTTLVRFNYGENMDQANLKLTTQLARMTALLPDGAETRVITGSMDDLPVLQLAITTTEADVTPEALATAVGIVLVPKLEALEHVRSVDVAGYSQQVVTIIPNPVAMAQRGVTMAQVTGLLRSYGLQAPAGGVAEGDKVIPVIVGTPLTTAEEIASLVIPATTDDGGPAPGVALSDIAAVEQAAAPPDSLSRLNGATAVSVSVTKTPAGNTVDVSQAVADLIKDSREALDSQGLNVEVAFDQAPFITRSIDGLTTEGLYGLGFAILIILFFLLSLRSTIVAGLSIPLSLLIAFSVMKVTGSSLNILTLGGLTIAIGRVVDDSIVVIENIKRHLSYGQDKRAAIVRAVGEVGGAIAASTVCTVAVFAPIGFVGGAVGELFRPFAMTVTAALAASLLVALTIVPVLAYWFLKAPVSLDEEDQRLRQEAAEAKEKRGPLQRAYIPTVRGAVRHPIITIFIALAVLGGTASQVTRLEMNFLGAMGQDTVTVTQTFAPATSLATQDEEAQAVEAKLMGLTGVASVQTTVGGGQMMGLRMAGAPTATFSITLDDGSDAAKAPERIRGAVSNAGGPATRSIRVSEGQAMMGSTTVDLVVRSTIPGNLAEATLAVVDLAESVTGVSEVSSTLAEDQPTVEVTVDTAAAAGLGMDEASVLGLVSSTMGPTTLGSILTEAGTMTVKLASAGPAPTTVEELTSLPLGPGATLGDVASVVVASGPAVLTRVGGQRSATVSLTPDTNDLLGLSNRIRASLDSLDLPPGVTVEVAGVAREQANAFADLGMALIVAIAIVFIVMVATFGSLAQPFILLVSIPFAATGALAAMLLSSTPVGVAALIGALMLVGIVVSNAIVLIDRINQVRREGVLGLEEAIVEGARVRLRPVLMTAAATVFALVPMAVGLTGHGAFLSQPLALVVIGGLCSSTLLTLVVVPALYRFEGAAHDRRVARRAVRLEKARERRRAARERDLERVGRGVGAEAPIVEVGTPIVEAEAPEVEVGTP